MPIVKNLAFGDDARKSLINGVNKIANAVKSTLGARGNTVLIESENHTQGVVITKDGITVAKSITLLDPIENLAVELVRQAADRTAVHAGDGTTSAIVLTQGIVLSATELIKPHMNKIAIIRHIRNASEKIIERISEMAIPITDANLHNVCVISANGDVELGGLISDAYKNVGLGGTVLIDKSKSQHSYSEVTDGMRLNVGWTSKYFVTDVVKQECVMLNPLIFVCDAKIRSLQDIMHLVEYSASMRRPFLVIGQSEDNLIDAMNKTMQSRARPLDIAHIGSKMGYYGAESQEDIAVITGASYWSASMGDEFGVVSEDMLGSASKVIIGRDSTIIIPHENEDIASRKEAVIKSIEQRISECTQVDELNYLKERLSNLQGAVAKVYIGAVSEIEYKELRDRADDCVGSASAAISNGIVPGGGVALLSISNEMTYGEDEEGRVAWHILKKAIQAPFYQILENGGLELTENDKSFVGKDGFGINAVSGECVNMVDAGIIDPAKITITALENAVSVATTLLSTNAVVTNVSVDANK